MMKFDDSMLPTLLSMYDAFNPIPLDFLVAMNRILIDFPDALSPRCVVVTHMSSHWDALFSFFQYANSSHLCILLGCL